MISRLRISFIAASITLLSGPSALAGHFGFGVGIGAPYVTQYGLNYVTPKFGIDFTYNALSVTTGLSKASLTKPEVNFKWHPFGAALFLGLGVGQQTLSAEATDLTTGETAKVEVTSLAITPNLGWLWGKTDGGLYFGIDVGYQSPSSPKTTITSALPTDNQAYIDAVKQGNDLGEIALPVFTFFRLGYLF